MSKTVVAAIAIVAALVSALTMGSALKDEPQGLEQAQPLIPPFQFTGGGSRIKKVGEQIWEISWGPIVVKNGDDDKRTTVFTRGAWDYSDRPFNASIRHEAEAWCEISGQRIDFPVTIGPEDEFTLVMLVDGTGTSLVSAYKIDILFESTERDIRVGIGLL